MMRRFLFRRSMLAILLAAATVAGTVTWLTRSAAAAREAEVLRHVGLGLAFADSMERSLGTRAPGAIARGEAVAGLYLERLRLGLGSPFRMIDQALRDPDVSPELRRPLAEAMLARTLYGLTYRAGHAALDLIEVDRGSGLGPGRVHQAIIDSVVAASDDPRIGELAVRLAYRLGAASGVLSPRAPEIATAAAAQARDRVLATRDARDLVTAAERGDVGQFALLRMWRETRRFAVERPVIVPLSPRAEREAIARLPQLVARVEAVSGTLPDSGGVTASRSGMIPAAQGDGLASRMAAVAGVRDAPPQAPVVIAVSGYAALVTGTATDAGTIARRRFVLSSVNEESLAAEYALLRVRSRGEVPGAALAVLTAGVALRPYGQERIPGVGDPSPTARDLQSRLGVAVTFDGSVRPGWRPVLLRNLDGAIEDLRRTLPGFDPRGLRVHLGPSPMGDRALAMHDPIGRVIYFPVGSSSGVMAHEFAHDLDWQAARREYGGTGWYRTDHAARQPSDVLAGALRQMASATRGGSLGKTARDRPTEVFARNVDWYVSAALAREGRTNGHLSAAQDPVLTGYAAAITPEAARDGGSATLRALDRLTTLPAPARDWFSGWFGAERRLSVHEAMRQVLESPAPRFDLRRPPASLHRALDGTRSLFTAAPEVSGAWRCVLDGFSERGTDAAAVRAVVVYTAEARARGLVRMWREFALRNPERSPASLRALTGAPWDPGHQAETLRQIRDGILWSALTAPERDVRDPFQGVAPGIRAAWSC